jgi:hypothetical protein
VHSDLIDPDFFGKNNPLTASPDRREGLDRFVQLLDQDLE